MAKNEIKMKMSLDSSGVKTALKSAQETIKSFAVKASEKLETVSKIGLGAIVGGFGAAARSAIGYAKEVENLARISNASGEEFQQMAYAARTVGIEQDKLADIYKDFNERVGQFLRGEGGEMAPFFEGLGKAAGVTAEKMLELSGPKGMELYIHTLMEAGLEHQELSSYMEDVASDATALLPLYEENSKLLKQLADDAKRLGLVMDDPTIKNLKRAEEQLAQLKQQATIAAADTLMGFKILGTASKQLAVDWKSNLGGIVKLLLGDVQGGVNQLGAGFGRASEAADESFDEIYGGAVQLENTMGIVVRDITSEWIDETVKQTNAYRRGNKEREKIAEDFQKTLDKANKIAAKAAEEREKRAMAAMTSEEKLFTIQQKILTLRKEIDEIDPFKDGAVEEIAAKKLKIEKLITEEQKTQVEVGEDAKAAQEAAIEAQMKELELRRLNAEAAGDDGLVAQLDRQIEREEMIQNITRLTNGDREKAARIVDDIIAKQDKRKQQELDILRAQADGNDALAAQLQMRVDKEQEALDLMNEFNISLEEATALAAKLAAMRAGPDLNQSGIVTPREQAQFDEQQKERQKQADAQLAQEMQDEREIGNRWRNVSEERRQTGSAAIRGLERADRDMRRRENKEIGEAMRRGGDVDALRADIAGRRARRQRDIDLERQIDAVNRGDGTIQERSEARRALREQQKQLRDEAKQLRDLRRRGKDQEAEDLQKQFDQDRLQKDLQKQAEEARAAGDKDRAAELEKMAKDVGDGKDLPKPKEPVKPEDKMIDKLGGKIDTTNQKLEDIKKLLTC